ncbi:MAG: hypothetical protein DRJ60_00595, partial [Thermoprotei archaeon]
MLTATPLLKARVYVHKDYLDKVLFNLGRESLVHLIDIKDDLPEEVTKGVIKPIEVSTRLYRISTLISKIDKIISSLGLSPKGRLEDYESEISNFSIFDAEALADSAERFLTSGNSSIVERVKSDYGEQLAKLSVVLRIIESLESAKMKMAETTTTTIFACWLPRSSLKRFIDVIDRASNGNYAIKYEEPKVYLKEIPHEKAEEKRLELVNLRFYIPKKYVDKVVYALTSVEHVLIDLRDILYTELKEKAKPLEPSPQLFKLSSLSSRIDVVLSSLGLRAPEDIKPLSQPIPAEKINEIDSIVSSIESEVFSILSKLESLKKSMEVASRVESEVASMASPQVPLTETIVHDVKGPLRVVMLQLTDEMTKLQSQLNKIRMEYGDKLIEFKRIIEGAKLVEEKKLKMAMTDNVVLLQLSVSKEKVESLLSTIKEVTEGNFTYREIAP